MPKFGKLIQIVEDAPDQEFLLSKPEITLGRATTNDVTLPGARVSRSHARLEFEPLGALLVDLNSGNGTWLNGSRIERAPLTPGDTIQIGDSTLRFVAETAEAPEDDLTRIDSESDLDRTMDTISLPMAINDTTRGRLVIYTPLRTWEISADFDSLTIGRSAENDLLLDFEKVSRRHARLERRPNGLMLRDLGSTNGVWIGERRVEETFLSNGEAFRIGPVQIVYKMPFQQEELTMADEPAARRLSGLTPVVFVPGMMGSELYRGSERLWPDVKTLIRHPEWYELTGNTDLEPRGLVNEVVIVPNLIKLEQYSHMGDYLVDELGYERGVNYLEFAYDWRLDVRRSAQKLAEAIDAWGVTPPIVLIAHSLGTLVSRYYVERLGGRSKVGRLVLMGGPHQGVPKIVADLVSGVHLLPFGLMGQRLTQVISTFDSVYQILPLYACALDDGGRPINFLEDETWLAPEKVPLLRQAREFRRQLGQRSSVPTLSIFGYGLKTVTGLRLQRPSGQPNLSVAFDQTPRGDSTIPESSAVLPGTEIHPVQQYHGTLFVDNDVRMRLKLELARGF